MLEHTLDQAQGLRRMFAPGAARVIEVLAASPGVGRRTVAVQLADALARAGRDTRLVDGDRFSAAGGAAEHDTQAASLMGAAAAGVSAHAAPDVILVTASTPHALPWTGAAAAQTLLVVAAAAPAITAAYAWLKRVASQFPALRCHVLVNRAASEAEARKVLRNLAGAARAYLGIQLQGCGFVPEDPALALAAARGESVLQADPQAPASRALHQVTQRLMRLPAPHRIAETAFEGPGQPRSAAALSSTPF